MSMELKAIGTSNKEYRYIGCIPYKDYRYEFFNHVKPSEGLVGSGNEIYDKRGCNEILLSLENYLNKTKDLKHSDYMPGYTDRTMCEIRRFVKFLRCCERGYECWY